MAAQCVAVAYSGGRDSTALLHCVLRTVQEAARPRDVQVLALHVHHGLQPAADAWLAHAQAQCERWRKRGLPVRFEACRLQGGPGPGDSVEAWARKERYRALARMARAAGASLVLLAHHRGDQAETFMLQALRGAGPAGLSAMPCVAQRDGLTWARPWLNEPRSAIEAYVRRHRLRYVDDGSNEDPRFARNRLRLQAWPALQAAFLDAEASLSAAAARMQQAQAALDELAALDLQEAAQGDALMLDAWRALSAARQVNAMRAWLSRHGAVTLLERLVHEWPRARSGARWPAPAGELRNYRGALRFHPGEFAASAASAPPAELSIRGAGRIELPQWGGALVARRVHSGGIALAVLAHCELRERRGGEQFQRSPRGIARSLKKQYQAAGVPEWERGGPLLFGDGQLLFVPGLGIDARHCADAGVEQLALRWEPSGPAR